MRLLGKKPDIHWGCIIDQDLNLQFDILNNSGYTTDFIFTDKTSGVKFTQPGLDKCFDELSQGDIFIVWRREHLGLLMSDLINLIE